MDILGEYKFFEHDGGTKYYEVISLSNVAGGRHAVIYRWGAMATQKSGGQTKVERFTDIRRMQDAARRKILEKTNKGYRPTGVAFGIHDENSTLDSDTLRLTLGAHYGTVQMIDSVMDALGLEDTIGVATAEPDDIVVEEPAPEIERDGDWGSW